VSVDTVTTEAEAAATTEPLPQVQLGPHSISRLICGANPFNGGSHLSTFVNAQMREYYNEQQVMKTLRRCQEVGVNCWQSGGGNLPWYRKFRELGGEMRFISLGCGEHDAHGDELERLSAAGCIAVAHHGEVTDSLFKQGQVDSVRPYLDRVRDAGMLAGVSTHIPAVVDYIESARWDLDFYMTCVYERHRTAEELTALLGQAPIPVSEVYLPNDPPRMFKAMRSTERPCLAFKILAAGRLSERAEWVEQAFRETFASIKANDAVIVGIYDRHSDQPAENAEFTRRFSPLSARSRSAG